MYLRRQQENNVKKLMEWYPVVSVTGPRQSGKSTLLKNSFADFEYVNLEDPQTRRRSEEDPVGFIRDSSSKLIIDEAQLVPDLFSMVQVVCDEKKENGRYILSGSQNFLLSKHIGQSLAGRVGIVKLLPLSFSELVEQNFDVNAETFMFKGGYPQLYSDKIPKELLFQNYVSTYVERDVADYLDVRNKQAFTQFLFLIAKMAGNLINITKLANNLDVSFQTVKSWISILESSYIIFTLPPYHTNSKKSLTKTSKIYFWDTGFLCYLLGINSEAELLRDEQLGSVFENFAISEMSKNILNSGKTPILYFYRDDSKREIDLLDFTDRKNLKAYEIKSSRTYHNKFAKQLSSVCDEIGVREEQRSVVCRVEGSYVSDGVSVTSIQDFLLKNVND